MARRSSRAARRELRRRSRASACCSPARTAPARPRCCAPSPACSIRRKGRCSGAARPRAATRDEFHAELAYLGHEPPLKGDLSARENLQLFHRHPPRGHAGGNRCRARAHRRAAPSPIAPCACCPRASGAAWRSAGVLLANAVLWLLDEPTTNLDADGQQLVRDLIDEQLARDGIVVAAVHHSLPLPPERLVTARARAVMKTEPPWQPPGWSRCVTCVSLSGNLRSSFSHSCSS